MHWLGQQWRFVTLIIVLMSVVVLIAARLVFLQVIDVDHLQNESQKRSWRTEVIPGQRGVISDRDGNPLAVSTPMKTFTTNIKDLREADIGAIAEFLELDGQELYEKVQSYRENDRRFMYLKRMVDPVSAQAMIDADFDGVYVTTEYKRFYPLSEVTAHIVGVTNNEGKGQEGLELSFEGALQSANGSLKVLLDKHGRVVTELSEEEPAKNGTNIALTIDSALQHLVFDELYKAVKENGAASASVVLMDPKTGEILALVNQPVYNPNNRATLKPEYLRNRAMIDVFEPGSVVKPFTIAAALESGKYGLWTPIETNQSMVIDGYRIRDAANYGTVDLTKIIVKSSNVGAAKIGLHLGNEILWDMFDSVGFGQSLGLGYPGESSGSLPNFVRWPKARIASLSFGYGLTTNIVQLARAYSAIANDGVLPGVQLIKNQFHDEPVRVMSEETARLIRPMLEKVIATEGTAKTAALAYYSAGGKTGTVRKVGKNGYDEDRHRAVFVGMAPIDNPQLVAAIVIDEPNTGKYHGGDVAAPVFARIMDRALQLRNVTPEKLANQVDLASQGAK